MNLTTPDLIVLVIFAVLLAILIAHWPKGYGYDSRKALYFKLGVNALRLSWEGKGHNGGFHEIKIMLGRKGEEFPTVGDVLRFVEQDQRSWRGRVENIRLLPSNNIPRTKPAAIVVVEAIY